MARKKRDKSAEDRRLALLARELGVAMVMVLVNDYGFTNQQADEALGKVLTQAQETRLMITTLGVTAAYDALGKTAKNE